MISESRKNAFISTLPRRNKNSPINGSDVWIGAKVSISRKDEKILQWIDRTEIGPYSGSWMIGEPDLKNGDCTLLNSKSDSENWRLEVCETLLPFMCQMTACPKNTTQCLAESTCINSDKICDGVVDCDSRSDEFDCPIPKTCSFHLTGSSGSFGSPNQPKNYPNNASCLWLIEAPTGTKVDVQFLDFATEDAKDIVTVLGGSPLPAKSQPLATLSGQLSSSNLRYRSSNNFLIVKFTSDLSVEMPGFVATWKAVLPECGGDMIATDTFQTIKLTSTPADPLGAVECVYRISGQPGTVITAELLEKTWDTNGNDLLHIRNGNSAKSQLLAALNGQAGSNDTVFQSTSNQLYVYVRLTGGSGTSILAMRFAATCDLELTNSTGIIKTPGFDILSPYPRNLACSWRIKPSSPRPFVIRVTKLVAETMDHFEIFAIESTTTKTLFSNQNSTGPSFVLHVTSGDALIKLVSGPIGETSRFFASYSVDCPALTKGDLVILSSNDRTLGAEVTITCPVGYELASQDLTVTTKCGPGGVWSLPRIPQCQPRYCGPAPRFPNTVPVNVTSFNYLGVIDYRCSSGFVFETGLESASVQCTADGTWVGTPVCQPIKCPDVVLRPASLKHVRTSVLLGNGYDFG